MCSIYFLKLQCWAQHSCFLGLYLSHISQHIVDSDLSGFSSWLLVARPKLQCLGHVPRVLRNWTMPSERCCLNGFDHFRERKARARGWWGLFCYCLTRQCSDDPISMRILGASNTPKNESILNFDDLGCFLDALVFLFHGLLCSYLSFFVPFPVA